MDIWRLFTGHTGWDHVSLNLPKSPQLGQLKIEAPGSKPKHNIYAFSIYIWYGVWKERKNKKRPGLDQFLKMLVLGQLIWTQQSNNWRSGNKEKC